MGGRGLDELTKVFWITSFILTHQWAVFAGQPCAYFHFPTLNNTVPTTASIPFSVQLFNDSTTCLPDQYILSVKDRNSKSICKLLHINDTCFEPNKSKCTCPSNETPYNLHYTFDCHENQPVTLRWSLDKGKEVLSEKAINFSVPCPPEIRLLSYTQNETGAYLQLSVRAHTTGVFGCELNKSASGLTCNVTTVTGTPPDLVLTVRLDNVKKQDEGQWTLTLTNDAEQGHLDFYLNFTGENANTQNANTQTELVTSLVTASAAAVVAVVVVVVAVCWACKKRKDSKNRLPLGPWELETLQSILSSQSEMAISSRLARSEECVMLHNFLYDGSRSMPDISEAPYAEVHDHLAAKLMDVDNRPPAPLPPDAEDEEATQVPSDYAVIDDGAEDTDEHGAVASTNEYVPIRDIIERKRETQFEDASDVSEEGDDKKNVSGAEGSTMSLDLKLFEL